MTDPVEKAAKELLEAYDDAVIACHKMAEELGETLD